MKWTEAERNLVKENLHLTNPELEQLLGKSTASVRAFLAHNKLRKIKKGVYTPEEEAYLKENFLNLNNEQLGRALQRTANGISFKLKNLELFRPEAPAPELRDDMTEEEIRERARIINADYLKLFGYKAA